MNNQKVPWIYLSERILIANDVVVMKILSLQMPCHTLKCNFLAKLMRERRKLIGSYLVLRVCCVGNHTMRKSIGYVDQVLAQTQINRATGVLLFSSHQGRGAKNDRWVSGLSFGCKNRNYERALDPCFLVQLFRISNFGLFFESFSVLLNSSFHIFLPMTFCPLHMQSPCMKKFQFLNKFFLSILFIVRCRD